MSERIWIWLSLIVSVALTVVLVLLWSEMDQYEPERVELVNDTAVDRYLAGHWEAELPSQTEPTIRIKTGIFIESLEFFNSSEVNVTGYVWQHYEDGVHDQVKPGPSEVGFVLPEQVNSGLDIEPREVYRHR